MKFLQNSTNEQLKAQVTIEYRKGRFVIPYRQFTVMTQLCVSILIQHCNSAEQVNCNMICSSEWADISRFRTSKKHNNLHALASKEYDNFRTHKNTDTHRVAYFLL